MYYKNTQHWGDRDVWWPNWEGQAVSVMVDLSQLIKAAERGKVCKKEAYKMLSEIDISDGNRLCYVP